MEKPLPVQPMTAFEKHYRVKDLATLWAVSADTITRLFRSEPEVPRVDNLGSGKRNYSVLSIPESVALRVHERLSNQALKAELPAADPLRIIRLGDLDAGVSK